jgi:hypothetical protein
MHCLHYLKVWLHKQWFSCCDMLRHVATCCDMLQYVATCCNMLGHAATCCDMLQHAATCCDMLRHAARHRATKLEPTLSVCCAATLDTARHDFFVCVNRPTYVKLSSARGKTSSKPASEDYKGFSNICTLSWAREKIHKILENRKTSMGSSSSYLFPTFNNVTVFGKN